MSLPSNNSPAVSLEGATFVHFLVNLKGWKTACLKIFLAMPLRQQYALFTVVLTDTQCNSDI